MKKIILTIILFALSVALIIGVVIPIMQEIKSTGQKTFNSVNSMNSNIRETP